MNANSFKHALTKQLHLVFITTLIAGLLMFAGERQVSASGTVTIVDSLGIATTDTQFSLSGITGLAVFDFQFVGPQFILTQPTTITEIGGFLNNCQGVIGIDCSGAPLIVQIRPSTNGVPDPSTVLASFVLSNDNDLQLVSYESVAIKLPLQPGTYFAIFTSQNHDSGLLLSSATSPFIYQAGLINIGVVDPITGATFLRQHFGAVRILGELHVLIDGCDSGLTDIVLPDNTTISELLAECADGATRHGQFVSCIAHVTDDLKRAGIITAQQKGKLQRCASQANIP